jgi:hypothetical protein
LPGRGFYPPRRSLTEAEIVRPWHEYKEGLRYMRGVPLVMGLLLINVGWASGGGAAQILFTIFGEIVFNRGPAGLGTIWSFAGLGLLAGGALGYAFGRGLSFTNYKRAIVVCYIVHGGSYVLFSQMRSFGWALFFIALSRAGVAMSSVLNMSQLLRIVPDALRGRVFATMESVTWSVMLISMTLAGIGCEYWNPRTIRRHCRRAQFLDRPVLGLGPLHRPPPRARTPRRGTGRNRGSSRAGGVNRRALGSLVA